ncbi:MAG: quinone oxidoreductase [Deltaproteobacteria bacterium]|nr:quinone oxidoreductase [Deltaproteobacteria bacterium]
MAGCIRVHETGGPEVLLWEEAPVRDAGPGEALIRQTAVGLNYIDVYFRKGLYPAPGLPFTPGMEGAGVVEVVGAGVADLAPGDRVAYAGAPIGSYAESRVMPADRLVKLPATIDDRIAAAMMLKGMTAQYLLKRTANLRSGDTILVHAAAGGVGLILCQWARSLGVRVIGTVGSEEKAALASSHGCDHTVIYTKENMVDRVREITAGEGVAVVYDSVGKDTFEASLDCLRPLGLLVSFGQSSGPVPAFDIGLLNLKGSLFLTRPSLFHYTMSRADLLATASDLFDVVAGGTVRIGVNQTYPLREAERSHRDLEARRTTGSTVLLP